MNSVRPLITVTILAVVGIFLYTKINSPPAMEVDEADAWNTPQATFADDGLLDPNAMGTGGPPLESGPAAPPVAGGPAPLRTADLPPAWRTDALAAAGTPPAAGSSAALPAPGAASATATTAAAATALPAPNGNLTPPALTAASLPPAPATASQPDSSMPPLPEIPPLADLPPLGDPGADASTAGAASAMPDSMTGTPSAMTAPPFATSPGMATQAAPGTAASAPNTAAGTGAVDRYGLPIQSAVASAPATTPPATPTPNTPAASSAPTSLSAETASTNSGFAVAQASVQSALERGELARAHLILSQWYGDPGLSAAESRQLEDLLSQLAGSVIYSTEHYLESPHVVKAGETLLTIAEQYSVPWRLLGKINGIATPEGVRPGQQLKVVRGPFGAMVEAGSNELTLVLDGRYAGKYRYQVRPGNSLPEGEYIVVDKLENSTPTSVSRAVVLRSMGTAENSPASTVVVGSPQAATQPEIAAQSGRPKEMNYASSPVMELSQKDSDDLADILSIGSEVMIRR